MPIDKQWKICPGILEEGNDVILELPQFSTAAWSARISKPSQINHQNFKLVPSIKISDQFEAGGMLPKPMHDANSILSILGGEFSKIEPHLIYLGVDVVFSYYVVFIFELS